MNCTLNLTLLFGALTFGLLAPSIVSADPYYYVGLPNGDFFDELNWNDASDGSGLSPLAGEINDSTSDAITLNLIIDGDSVVADGQVDFGSGSLTLETGSTFAVTGIGHDLDINSSSTFSMTDSTLTVDDVINFEGTSYFSGGTVESEANDIAFQDNFDDLTIIGTTFTSFDNIYFDGFAGTTIGATFISGDRFGVRNSVGITMTDTSITANSGTGDVDDVFSTLADGSSLTLLGASTLLADSVEEGADLTLGGTTVATMGGQGERITADGSTISITSFDVVLNVGALVDDVTTEYVDSRPFLINALAGLTYEQAPELWNVSNWNGLDAVSLQVIGVPEPSSILILLLGISVTGISSRKQG